MPNIYTPPTPTRRDKTVSSRRRRRCVLGFSNPLKFIESELQRAAKVKLIIA